MHQIHASHFLGHGVFHLQTCIGLDKDKWLSILSSRFVHQEFKRAKTGIPFFFREPDRRIDDLLTKYIVQTRSRCNLNNLLVHSLDAALTLAKMCNIAYEVTHNLHLNMAGTLHKLLYIDIFNPKRALRFTLTTLKDCW